MPPRDWSRLPIRRTRKTIHSWQSAAGLPQAPKAKPGTLILTGSSMASADVFMDTAGFLALWDASDEYHEKAIRLQNDLARKKRRFVTTDYILDETATLLLARHSHGAAADFLQTVTTTAALRLEWVDSERFHKAADFFTRHDDKEWSFTD